MVMDMGRYRITFTASYDVSVVTDAAGGREAMARAEALLGAAGAVCPESMSFGTTECVLRDLGVDRVEED